MRRTDICSHSLVLLLGGTLQLFKSILIMVSGDIVSFFVLPVINPLPFIHPFSSVFFFFLYVLLCGGGKKHLHSLGRLVSPFPCRLEKCGKARVRANNAFSWRGTSSKRGNIDETIERWNN